MKRGIDIVQALKNSKRSKSLDDSVESKLSKASPDLSQYAAVQISKEDVTVNPEVKSTIDNHKKEPPSIASSIKKSPKTVIGKHANSTKKPKKRTPLDQQFIDLKNEYPDCVLAIQVGYKYKFFGVDAVPVSRILNIMFIPGNLTERDDTHDKFAYCSVPDNRLHIHLQRLLTNGLKVAVVSQTESAVLREAESLKGLFLREVTAIYTKATYIEEGSGDFISCITWNGTSAGAVTVQPCTGEIIVEDFSEKEPEALSELQTYLHHLRPSEIIVTDNEATKENDKLSRLLKSFGGARISYKPFDEVSPIEELLPASIANYYVTNHSTTTTQCISQLITYLKDFSLDQIFTVPSNVSKFSTKMYMNLPGNTLKALEIFQNSSGTEKGTLFWHLDHTHTKMGRRMLQKWVSKPLIDNASIQERLDAIESLMNYNYAVEVFEGIIKKIGRDESDWEKSMIKIHYTANGSQNRVTRKEVVQLLLQFRSVIDTVYKFKSSFKDSSISKLLQSMFLELAELASTPIVNDLLSRVKIEAVYREEVEDQKKEFFDLDSHPHEGIKSELNAISELEQALQDELVEIKKIIKKPVDYMTVSREPYLIALRGDSGPQDWLKISATKTVTRYRPPKVSKLYKELLYHQEKLIQQCDEAFATFLKDIDSHYTYFSRLIKIVAEIDCLLSLKATSSSNSGYSKPILSDKQMIKAKRSRNPVIENLTSTLQYVANDIEISYDENRVLIITGPNMGGKSSYVKQVALIALMTQIGCYLPCESAIVGIFDTILVRMGAEDNILKGESTFMVEMLECSTIIKSLTNKSLVILDEIGRGTGTEDGIAIAYSIISYLIEEPRLPLTLFITHYPSLKVLEDTHPKNVANYHMGFMEVAKADQEWPDVTFLYTLKRGVVSNLYGLNVARLAGIPTEIITKAFKVAEALKQDIEDSELSSMGQILKSEQSSASKLVEIDRIVSYI